MQLYPLPLGYRPDAHLRGLRCRSTGRTRPSSQEDSDFAAQPEAGRACLAGFTAHISRRDGRGDDGLLRQPALHPVRDGRARRSRLRRRLPGHRRRVPWQVPQRRQRRHRDPATSAPTATPPPSCRRPPAHTGSRPRPSRVATTRTSGRRKATPGYDTEQTVGRRAGPAVAVRLRPTAEDRSPARQRRGHRHRSSQQHLRRRQRRRRRCRRRHRRRAASAARFAGPGCRSVRPRQRRPDDLHGPRRAPTARSTSPDVPDGNYQLTLWDERPGLHHRQLQRHGERRRGRRRREEGRSSGWFTEIHGHRLHRQQRQRQADPGEQGVPPVPADAAGARQLPDGPGHQHRSQTDNDGDYGITRELPARRKLVHPRGLQHAVQDDRHHLSRPTTSRRRRTFLGAAVDMNVLPVIGLRGRVDWGVQPYNGAENGGIVGTVTLRHDPQRDSTRPSPSPRTTSPASPGSGSTCTPPRSTATATRCTDPRRGGRALTDADGRLSKLSETVTSETWGQPRGCTARMWNGQPLTDQLALPPAGDRRPRCASSRR